MLDHEIEDAAKPYYIIPPRWFRFAPKHIQLAGLAAPCSV